MVERRWLNLSIRIGISLGLLYCIYLVSTRAVAFWHFSYGESPGGIRQAIEWDPGNPMYYAALARVLERSPQGADLDEVIALFERATELSPHRARYWAELGGAYELRGRAEEAEGAYERARDLFPNSPRINWRLGNFYLRAGKISEALRAFEKVLLGDPSLRRQTFDLAWRATDDAELILREMIPTDEKIVLQYLNYLAQSERVEPVNQVWTHLLALDAPFEPRAAFPYLDALIRKRQVARLNEVWQTLAQRNPNRIRRRRFESTLLTNGDFESEILNGGLGWRIQAVEGVVVRVDSLDFFDGTHSLQIWFDGEHNLNYHHIWQYVPVKPSTMYRFLGYLRAKEVTTDSGLRFQVFDAYDPSQLFLESENRVGTSSWSPEQFEFETGPETELLLIRIARPPSRKFDNKIAGTVWVDRLSLVAIE
ncbi:tetratricopeptide repeat protein [Acidobacteriia bacterium AH_259_A11_L15]|nr:tetratricopeptide repeat protein [Acidobacteriia bacterium AH_259_A11_L15]